MNKSTWKSIGALLAGFVVVIIPTIVTDEFLRRAGILPPLGQAPPDAPLLLATFYRTFYGVVGSYITARLAPNRPMQHALVGGFIGLAVSITGAVVTWNKGPAFGPHWYPVALVVLALPTAWVGGKLYERQLGAPAER